MSAEVSGIVSLDRVIAFFIVSGLPGAGKTTFIKTFLRYAAENELSKHFCSLFLDAFYTRRVREDTSGSSVFKPENWRLASQDLYEESRQQLISALETAVPSAKENAERKTFHSIILVEDNFYYRSMRMKYYRLCKRCNYSYWASLNSDTSTIEKKFVYFMELRFIANVDRCVLNNAGRRNKQSDLQLLLPDYVIYSIAELFESCVYPNEKEAKTRNDFGAQQVADLWRLEQNHTLPWTLLVTGSATKSPETYNEEEIQSFVKLQSTALVQLLTNSIVLEEIQRAQNQFFKYIGEKEKESNLTPASNTSETFIHEFDRILRTFVKNFFLHALQSHEKQTTSGRTNEGQGVGPQDKVLRKMVQNVKKKCLESFKKRCTQILQCEAKSEQVESKEAMISQVSAEVLSTFNKELFSLLQET